MEKELVKKASNNFLTDFAKRNGLPGPVNPATLEYRIGNTQRSDYEFAKGIKKAGETKELMDNASVADSLPDALDTVLKTRDRSNWQDPVDDYINAKLPKADYTEPAFPDAEELKQYAPRFVAAESGDDTGNDADNDTGNDAQESVTETDSHDDLRENADDITEDSREQFSIAEHFEENRGSMEVPDVTEPSIEQEFEENEEDLGL